MDKLRPLSGGGSCGGLTGPSGGGGGILNTGFQIIGVLDHIVIAKGNYSSGTFITWIEFHYQAGSVNRFGGSGTFDDTATFQLTTPNEYVIEIIGQCGVYLDSIRIVTNLGNSFPSGAGLYGGSGGAIQYLYRVSGTGNRIIGLWGRTGSWIDAIGVYTSAF